MEQTGEKVFVHLNRSDLLCGEVLWFNFFCVNAATHQPSRISQVGYVELLDRQGKPVVQTSLFLNDGLATGSLYLPASLPTDSYTLRAYTAWMRNQGPEWFHHTRVTVTNTLKSVLPQPVAIAKAGMRVVFYPEGGNLVQGLTSRIAFHAADPGGRGILVHGAILTGTDTVARFESGRHGLGAVSFTPQPGKIYRALALDKSGRNLVVELPDIAPSGYALHVKDTLNGLVQVRINGNRGPEELQMVIHTRHIQQHTERIILNAGPKVLLFDAGKLPSGISHITLFDRDGRPVAERLILRKPDNTKLTLKTTQSVYPLRARAQATFTAPQPGYYSISIFRTDSAVAENQLAATLLLTSDLRGEIEAPEFYFSGHPEAAPLADLLMMTHGWRRFRWNEAAASPAVKYLPELKGHLLSGRLLDTAETPVAGKAAFLASPGKMIRLYVARSDSFGRFTFDLRRHALGNRLVVQPDFRTDSLLHVEMESPFHAASVPFYLPPVRHAARNAEGLLARSIAVQAADIFREQETYFSYRPQPRDTVPFYGKPDERYRLDDYTRFPAMEEVLREYVKGVWVRLRNGQFRLRVLDQAHSEVFRENPLILLDGVPYPDVNRLMEVDPLRINEIAVVTRPFYLGPLKCPGILSLSSYTGDMGGVRPDPRSVVLDYESLERQREFASPAYNTAQARASRLPDTRYQLWFGTIRTNRPGSQEINFTTSDVEGRFTGTVEGITLDGKPYSGTLEFSVRR